MSFKPRQCKASLKATITSIILANNASIAGWSGVCGKSIGGAKVFTESIPDMLGNTSINDNILF